MAGDRSNTTNSPTQLRRYRRVAPAGAVLLAAAVILAGCGSSNSSNVQPRVMQDHWHAAYSVWVCDDYVPVSEFFDSTLGIHSHRDDLIHVHPTSRSAAGRNARLGVFTDSSPLLDLSDDEISVGDESWKEGEDTCVVDGEEAPGEVVVARWEDVLDEEETPTVHSSGVEDLRFRADREGYVIAFVPEGEYGDIPKPHPTALELLPLTSRSLDDILPSDADELFDELDPYDIEDYNFEDFVGEGQNAGGTDAEDEDEAEEAPGPALPDEDGDNS
jgi:hypothetical protein